MPAARLACLPAATLAAVLAAALPLAATAQTPASQVPMGQAPAGQVPTALPGGVQPGQTQPAQPQASHANPAGTHAAGPSARSPHHGGPSVMNGRASPESTDQRINDLHAKLHITPAQASQWDSFAQRMRINASDLSQALEQRAARIGTMSAVESMRSYADIEQARAQNLQKLAASFQDLYATFSDEQKHAADDLFRNGSPARAKHRGGKH
jgi:protein CpxP